MSNEINVDANAGTDSGMNKQQTTLFLLDNVDSFTYNLVDELDRKSVV